MNDIYLPLRSPECGQQIMNNSNESGCINKPHAEARYIIHPVHTYRYISDGKFLYVQPTRPTNEADQRKGNNL